MWIALLTDQSRDLRGLTFYFPILWGYTLLKKQKKCDLYAMGMIDLELFRDPGDNACLRVDRHSYKS